MNLWAESHLRAHGMETPMIRPSRYDYTPKRENEGLKYFSWGVALAAVFALGLYWSFRLLDYLVRVMR